MSFIIICIVALAIPYEIKMIMKLGDLKALKTICFQAKRFNEILHKFQLFLYEQQ